MFYVLEIQTDEGTGTIIPFTFSNRNEAEAKYHSLLAVAAVSKVEKHGSMLFTDDGFVLKSEVYNHAEVNE